MSTVVACMEQLMRRNKTVWSKATKTIRRGEYCFGLLTEDVAVIVKCTGKDGTVTDITFSPTTKVSDMKRQMAVVKEIPTNDLDQYGLFISTRPESVCLTSSEATNEVCQFCL